MIEKPHIKIDDKSTTQSVAGCIISTTKILFTDVTFLLTAALLP